MTNLYRIVVEDNSQEREPPQALRKALGSFTGLTALEARQRIQVLADGFKKWDATERVDYWGCNGRLVSFRRGELVRTYSIAPEGFSREEGT